MKKIRIILLFLIVFTVGFFAGFLYAQLPSQTPPSTDSDNDGYADGIDDGPHDARYHEKNKTAEFELSIGEPWTTQELAPFLSPNYTGVLIYLDTSGPDIIVELFTETSDNVSVAWNYTYNGMDSEVPHEFFYFFNRDVHEQFTKLVITNPEPTDSFAVMVTIYAIR